MFLGLVLIAFGWVLGAYAIWIDRENTDRRMAAIEASLREAFRRLP